MTARPENSSRTPIVLSFCRSHRKKLLAFFGMIAFCVVVWLRGDPEKQLTVSRETTWLTRPLKPDGRVDYVTALETEYSRRVTPDNNAVPLLIQAFGPGVVFDDLVEERPEDIELIYHHLGISPVPPQPEKFRWYREWGEPEHRPAVAEDYYVEEIEDVEYEEMEFHEFSQVLSFSSEFHLEHYWDELPASVAVEPWSRRQFPRVARWLDANATALQFVTTASRRPRYYWPHVSSRQPQLFYSRDLVMFQVRNAAQALKIRALLAIEEQRFADVAADFSAIARLMQRVDQERSLMHTLNNTAMENLLFDLVKAVVSLPDPPRNLLENWLEELKTLPIFAGLERQFHTARLEQMDSLQEAARRTDDSFYPFGSNAVTIRLLNNLVSWNGNARRKNLWFDEMTRILACKDYREQQQRIFELYERDTVEQGGACRCQDHSIPHWLPGGRATAQLTDGRPAMEMVLAARQLSTGRRLIGRLGCAIRRHQLVHGVYPTSISELDDAELRTLAAESLAKSELLFFGMPAGVRFYHIGRNQTDDGGRRDHTGYEDDIEITLGAAWASSKQP